MSAKIDGFEPENAMRVRAVGLKPSKMRRARAAAWTDGLREEW